eukprot:TRINITY_DN2586_c0_g1_i1.p1 TRINITY_DN2586_c0_g1~~TRINITY_DN2586_c0_g1_i1.p1  ORF type:complete len:129 (-),score=22.57 TRINITY_DN2586_c0_g1_i1:331-717(-)
MEMMTVDQENPSQLENTQLVARIVALSQEGQILLQQVLQSAMQFFKTLREVGSLGSSRTTLPLNAHLNLERDTYQTAVGRLEQIMGELSRLTRIVKQTDTPTQITEFDGKEELMARRDALRQVSHLHH